MKISIYQAKSGSVRLNVDISKQTIWATQAEISSLFDVERSVVTKHLRNIFNSKELIENSVCAKFAHTASDGKIVDKQKMINIILLLLER